MSINLQTGTNRIRKHTHIHKINTVRTQKENKKKTGSNYSDIGKNRREDYIVLLGIYFLYKMFINKIKKTSCINFWSNC